MSPLSVSTSWSGFGYSSIHPKFLAHCLTGGKGSPFWKGMFNFDQWARKGAPLLVGHAPFGRACSLLTMGEKGCAPFGRAHLLEGRAPFGRARPFWNGAHLLEGPVHF